MCQDAELIALIRSGDLSAFQALYNKYKVPVFQTALAITRDHYAAEEILQDCFVRAYLNIDRLDGSTSISPWLHRIAVNLAYNWVLRRRWTLPLEDIVDCLVAGPRTSPEHHLEEDELQRTLREAVDSLPFRQRVVLILYYLQGFSLGEIAQILDCPVGTVKSRLHYACEKLRAKLERKFQSQTAYELL